VLRLQRLYPRSLVKPAIGTVLVPRPTTARIGGTPLRDAALLDWARQLLEAVLGDDLVAGAGASGRTGHTVTAQDLWQPLVQPRSPRKDLT
jgi:transcription-repair coupling factor (superfamily II helicase)